MCNAGRKRFTIESEQRRSWVTKFSQAQRTSLLTPLAHQTLKIDRTSVCRVLRINPKPVQFYPVLKPMNLSDFYTGVHVSSAGRCADLSVGQSWEDFYVAGK
jgi:hypothetical protein